MHVLVLLALIFASTANASTYYVAKFGSDANTCSQSQSLTRPKLTISNAARCLRPGDTLFVRTGMYAEELTNVIPSGISWAAPVSVAAYAGDTVTIQPSTGANGALTFTGANQAYIVIDGMIIDCVNASAHCVSIQQGAHHVRIKNSELKNSPRSGVLGGVNSEFTKVKVHNHKDRGFDLNGSNDMIEQSEIYNNGGSGIYLYSNPPNNHNTTIASNRVYRNNAAGTDGSGITIGSGDNIRVYNNLIYSQSGATTHGIVITANAVKAQVYNNTIDKNPGYGIVVESSVKGAAITNNILSSNAQGGIHDLGTGTSLKSNLIQ